MAKTDRYAHLNAEASGVDSLATDDEPDRRQSEAGLRVTITDGDQEVVVELADDSLTVDDVRRSLERSSRPSGTLPAPARLALTASQQSVKASTAVQRYVAGAPVRAAATMMPWSRK